VSPATTRLTAAAVAVVLAAGLGVSAFAAGTVKQPRTHPPTPVERARELGRAPSLEELVHQALHDLQAATIAYAIARGGHAWGVIPARRRELNRVEDRLERTLRRFRITAPSERTLPQEGVAPADAVRRTSARLDELRRYAAAQRQQLDPQDPVYTETAIELEEAQLFSELQWERDALPAELAAAIADEAVARGTLIGRRAVAAPAPQLAAAELAAAELEVERANAARLAIEARVRETPPDPIAPILAGIDRRVVSAEEHLQMAGLADLTTQQSPAAAQRTLGRLVARQRAIDSDAAAINRSIQQLAGVEGVEPARLQEALARAEARRTVAGSHQRQLAEVIDRFTGAPVEGALTAVRDEQARLADADAIIDQAARQVAAGADLRPPLDEGRFDEAARLAADDQPATMDDDRFAELARLATAGETGSPDDDVLARLAARIAQQDALTGAVVVPEEAPAEEGAAPAPELMVPAPGAGVSLGLEVRQPAPEVDYWKQVLGGE
jgi:hypothetical protein